MVASVYWSGIAIWLAGAAILAIPVAGTVLCTFLANRNKRADWDFNPDTFDHDWWRYD
jgi:hypothetical protein